MSVRDKKNKSAGEDRPTAAPPGGSADAESAHGLRIRWGLILVFALSVFGLLAVLSYDPRDSAILSGGIQYAEPHNLIGYAGAYVARALFLIFGFGAYPLVVILLLSSLRRLLIFRPARETRWEYWGAVFMTVLGVSMLFGLWPEAGAGLARALNLARTPGGALGQRLCDPVDGCIRIVMNRTGSAVLSVGLVLVGLGVLWVYDWHDLALDFYRKRRKAREESEESTTGILRRPEPESQEAPAPKPKRTPKRKPAESPEVLPGLNIAGRKKKTKNTPAPPAGATLPAAHPGPGPGARKKASYQLPPVNLLDESDGVETTVDPDEVKLKKEILQETLDSFDIDAKVIGTTSGPRVTLFEVLPAPGVKVERIRQISNNIAMELRALSLRILTPIPGRKSVGIEVPNASAAVVRLRSLMETPAWRKTKAAIPLLLGRNISGNVVILDLAQAPHLLIAGATGSGKSVCMNTLIMSMLYRFNPEELRLIMVDPKVVEFRMYENLPHLVVPVVSDVKKVPLALRWVIREMERRYQWLAQVKARNIKAFNSLPPRKGAPLLDKEGKPVPDRLPYIVVIIDELADIMMTAKSDVETSLARIAQLSRAVGIHTIIATQRPSVNVITGTIKANFPTRIAFQVTSHVDSRTILDGKGAEALLGQGDMLFKPPGASKLERNQGALVLDEEIERTVEFWANQAEQNFDDEVFRSLENDGADAAAGGGAAPVTDMDEELIQKAVDIILRDRRATTSYIQRCLRIGYNRAAMIMEILEQRGIIGPQIGTAPREILIAAPETGLPGESEGEAAPPGGDSPTDEDQGEDFDDGPDAED